MIVIFLQSCDFVSKKLNILFNNIVRYVYGLRRYGHVARFTLKLYCVSFDNLLSIRVLLLLHKIIYSVSSGYLSDKIRFARSLRGKRIVIPLHRHHVREWHFLFMLHGFGIVFHILSNLNLNFYLIFFTLSTHSITLQSSQIHRTLLWYTLHRNWLFMDFGRCLPHIWRYAQCCRTQRLRDILSSSNCQYIRALCQRVITTEEQYIHNGPLQHFSQDY